MKAEDYKNRLIALGKRWRARANTFLVDNEYYLLQGKLHPKFGATLADILLKQAIICHATAYKDSFKIAGLRLDDFTNAVAFLEKRASLGLGGVRGKYNKAALKLASNVTERVQAHLVKVQARITASGLHVKGATEELKKEYDALGITARNSYTIEGVVRTQTSIAYNVGKWQSEQEDAIQDILWGYTYSTVGDDAVRQEHRIIEGVRLPKEDAFWEKNYPPNGWSCRCMALPEYEKQRIINPGATYSGPDDGFDYNFGKLFD